jgi:hypothetical protein
MPYLSQFPLRLAIAITYAALVLLLCPFVAIFIATTTAYSALTPKNSLESLLSLDFYEKE